MSVITTTKASSWPRVASLIVASSCFFFALDAMCRFLLSQAQDPVSEARMDPLVLRQVIRRRIWCAPEADRLDDLAGDNACSRRSLLIDHFPVDHGIIPRLLFWSARR
jgi:hypothetical protein